MIQNIPKESRLGRIKNFKTDNILKNLKILKKIENLYRHMHELSTEEIEEMWPSVGHSIASNNAKNASKILRHHEKEFLISLLAHNIQTTGAINFAKEKADLDLYDTRTQEVLQRRYSEEIGKAC